LCLLFRRRLPIRAFVDGVVLPALDGVEQDLGGFLDAFEEGVVVDATGRSFFVGMVFENFFAVGALDLLFGGFVAVLGEAEDGVVVLVLFGLPSQ
jgi:hypothetical protein